MKLLLTFFRIHITQTHRRKKKSSPHFPTYQSFISYRYVGLTDLLLVTHQMKWRITAKPIPISTHLCWHVKWTNWPSPLKLFLVVINKNKARILNRIHRRTQKALNWLKIWHTDFLDCPTVFIWLSMTFDMFEGYYTKVLWED